MRQKSKAITALCDYPLGELRSLCTFNPKTNMIAAMRKSEISSIPNPAVLTQAGLGVL
jgi:hypothetical protein